MHRIGNLAPFIGAIGTIIGVVWTFHVLQSGPVIEFNAMLVGIFIAISTTFILMALSMIFVFLNSRIMRDK